MNAKILLLALTVAAFSSCTTAYKSGQTPDDVYYSPIKVVEENNNNDQQQDQAQNNRQTAEDRQIRWGIRDRRWRDWNDDYDYSYHNSPYGYCSCSCNNSGYYYNPYYSPWPVYNPKVNPVMVNSTPRMINLGGYNGYNNAVNSNPKSGGNTNWASPGKQYNNSNNQTGFGRVVRQIFSPGSATNNTGSNNNSSSGNNTRTYSPSSSSSSSSGSSSSGQPVTRPGRN